jgi:hypothetical protein
MPGDLSARDMGQTGGYFTGGGDRNINYDPQRRRRRTGLRVGILLAIIAVATAIGITLAVNYEGSYQSPDPGSSSNP